VRIVWGTAERVLAFPRDAVRDGGVDPRLHRALRGRLVSDLKSDTIRLTPWHIASRACKAALIPLDAGERRFRGGMLGYTRVR
jgi:hypothetical protein